MVVEFANNENFATKTAHEGVTLVKVGAEWCGPCQYINPILAELADEYADRAKIVSVDVDMCHDVAEELGISNVPTLIVYKGGKRIETAIGAMPKSEIAKLLDKYL